MTQRDDFREMASILRKNKIGHYSLRQMAYYWEQFVAFVESAGYSDYLPEWDFDIWQRNTIEKALHIPELQHYPEFDGFKKRIHQIDERLKACFIPGVKRHGAQYWWDEGIVKEGRGDYAADIKLTYILSN